MRCASSATARRAAGGAPKQGDMGADVCRCKNPTTDGFGANEHIATPPDSSSKGASVSVCWTKRRFGMLIPDRSC